MMKGNLSKVIVAAVLILGILASSTASGRQFATEEDRDWAKEMLKQEEALVPSTVKNSVAVIPFENMTGWAYLDPLEKGLAILIMADLAKLLNQSEGFHLVERAKIQAAVDELEPDGTGLPVSDETLAKLGKMLGAEHVVGGNIAGDGVEKLWLDSTMLNDLQEGKYANPRADGQSLADFFEMEKKLVRQIIANLGITLTGEQEEQLNRQPTTNLQAFLYWIEAIESADKGDIAGAEEKLKKAIDEDPALADDPDFGSTVGEVAEILAGDAGPEADRSGYSPPAEDPATGSDAIAGDIVSEAAAGMTVDNGQASEDPTDRRIIADMDRDGISADEGDCDDSNPGVHPGSIEICDGLDNDCDQAIDEDLQLGPCTVGFGECTATGSLICNASGIAVCDATAGLPSAETCDGLDNDCDGSIDEGLGTVTCGTGECAVEVAACINGVEPLCTPGTPTAEICDGLDNDCDGSADEGLGALITCGTGACAVEMVACQEGEEPVCVPGTPSAEICDGLDNDCDGSIDEGLDALITCGEGACAVGIAACINGEEQTCIPGTPTGEICDGLDNDCDGSIDEGLGSLTCGEGECGIETAACVNGEEQTCIPGTPTGEICDGLDNDCDGSVDEDFNLGNACTVGIGACAADGSLVCGADGTVVCRVLAGSPPPSVEICDNLDNDCDGFIDEDFDVDGDGYAICANDCNDANPAVHPGAPDFCNDAIDNDCDGITNNNCQFVEQTTPAIVARASLYEAEENYKTDDGIRNEVDSGSYQPGNMAVDPDADWGFSWSGSYEPGLQSVGTDLVAEPVAAGDQNQYVSNYQVRDYVNDAVLQQIQQNDFLAYAVQVEEDRLNSEVLEKYGEAVGGGSLLDEIDDALHFGDIRSRDDLLLREADAQSGRVLLDSRGQWVRTQQYILTPATDQVQLVNVSLRGQTGGGSTIDSMEVTAILPPKGGTFQDRIRSGLVNPVSGSSIRFEHKDLNSSGTITNQDWLEEYVRGHETYFDTNLFVPPDVTRFVYDTKLNDHGEFERSPADSPLPEDASNPGGFKYTTRYTYTGPEGPDAIPGQSYVDEPFLVKIAVVGDADTAGNRGKSDNDYSDLTFTSFWDVLRTNEQGGNNIGPNNLDIQIIYNGYNTLGENSPGVYSKAPSFHVVFTPMSRMVWRQQL
jgi:TolB-like protein